MVNESLTKFDTNREVVPNLAESWKISDDGLTYTFTLRSGVKFTDGEPFDATAAKYTLDRLLSGKVFNGQPQLLVVVDKVQAPSPTELKITLKEPYGGLLAALTLPSAGMVAPKNTEEAPNTYKTIALPVGTGPYMYADAKVGSDMTLKANPDYWGQKPYYGQQIFNIVPEASSRVALIRSGQADVAQLPPMSNLKALEADPTMTVEKADTSMMLQVFINNSKSGNPLLQKPEVRQALSLAIDRKTIVDKVLFGAGTLPEGILQKDVFGACANGDYSYDPEKAKQLLASAGAQGMTLKMQSPQGRYLQDAQVGEAVAGYLRAVGVKVEAANPLPFADYIAKLYVEPEKQASDLSLIGLSASFGDASQALRYLTTASIPPNGFNSMYYSNPQFDALVKQGNTETDQDKRADLYCQAQKLVADDLPTLLLYSQNTPLVAKNSIKGIYDINTWFVTTYAYDTAE
jgi:ABC-type transport system substrate-binding protein